MQTRQFPRTLEQAFGPYARGPVHPKPEPGPSFEAVGVISAIVGIVVLVAIVIGVL